MKNIVNIKSLLIAFFIITSVSCSDDFFEQDAGNRITPDKHYKSMEDLYSSIDGLYGIMQQPVANLVLTDGLLSDAITTTGNADNYMREIENHSISAQNPYINVADFYKTIVNINEILNNIDKVAVLNPMSLDSLNLHHTKGALIGLRAYAYLSICRLYGNAALVDGNLTQLPANITPNIISKEAMIDTLINQLLPYVYVYINSGKSEFYIDNTINTKAMLGELYLEKNDYSNAAKYLQAASESYDNSTSTYKVDKSFSKESWKLIFQSGPNIENISVVGFSRTGGQPNKLTQWMLYTDQYVVKPSNTIVSLFETQTYKAKTGDAYRGAGISYKYIPGTTEAYINKYSIDEIEPYSSTIIISRAADLHLLLAEALNRLGNYNAALTLLNDGFINASPRPTEFFSWKNNLGIRGRAYLDAKELDPSITDPNAIMIAVEDLIIEERSMELAFEGKRWFDLMRIANRRNDPNYLASKVAAKFSDPAKAAEIKTLLMDPAKWYLPAIY